MWELLVFQMCAVCIGFDGHVCPYQDGVEQFWNCDEAWTIMVIPNSQEWYSTNLGHSVFGEWYEDHTGVMIIVGHAQIKDPLGYSVFTHEVRHAQCRCTWY